MSPLFNKPGDDPQPAGQQNDDEEVKGAGTELEPARALRIDPPGPVPVTGDHTGISEADLDKAAADLAERESKGRRTVENHRAGQVDGPKTKSSKWDAAIVWLTRIAQIAALILAVIQVIRLWPAGGVQEIWNLLGWIIMALVFWSPF